MHECSNLESVEKLINFALNVNVVLYLENLFVMFHLSPFYLI